MNNEDFVIGFVLGALGAAAGVIVGYKVAKEEFGNLDDRLDGIEHYASDAANNAKLTYLWTNGTLLKDEEDLKKFLED